jgi:hypothetical protein
MWRARPVIVCPAGVLPIICMAKALRAELQITASKRDYASEPGD